MDFPKGNASAMIEVGDRTACRWQIAVAIVWLLGSTQSATHQVIGLSALDAGDLCGCRLPHFVFNDSAESAKRD
jgi:hypothetical protein